jgi:hypothetical protein
MRSVFEALKANPNFLEEAFLSPLGLKPTGDEKAKSLKDWVDFSLLPPFDRIAKYLYLSVYAGKLSSEGFSLKVFSPTPPQMKQ